MRTPLPLLLSAIVLTLTGCAKVYFSETAQPSNISQPSQLVTSLVVNNPAVEETHLITSAPTTPLAEIHGTQIVPSKTPMVKASLTARITATKTQESQLPERNIIQSCLAVEDEPPSDFDLEGKIIRVCRQGVCALDLQNLTSSEVPITPSKGDIYNPSFHISPDGKWLAYEDVVYNQNKEIVSRHLRIVSTDGTDLRTKDRTRTCQNGRKPQN